MLGLLNDDNVLINVPPVRVAGSSPWLAPSLQKYREMPREQDTKVHRWSALSVLVYTKCRGLVPFLIEMVFHEVCAMTSVYERDQKTSWAGGLKN